MNSVTGEAISRAQVTMYGNESRTSLTDSDGRFSFDDVAQSFIGVMARKPGFSTPRRRFEQRTQSCSANSADAIKVQLVPNAAVVGRITDPNGDPVEEILVRMGKYEYNEGRRVFNIGSSATTDFDGRFRLGNLEAGSYILIAGPSSPQMLVALRGVTPATYFPGVSDRSAAATLELKPGATIDASMVVKEVPGFKVSGRIVGMTPEQRGVSVQITNSSGDEVGMTIGGRRGPDEFTVVGVPAGNYRVRATAYERGNAPVTGVAKLTVAKDVSNVQVPLSPPLTLQVNVRADGFDASQTRVSYSQGDGAHMENAPMVNVRLVNTEENGPEADSTLDGIKNPRWVVKNIAPGTYMAEINPIGAGYVQSARLGSIDLLRERVTITSDQDSIEVTLRNDAAEISGTIDSPAGSLLVAIPSSTVLFPPKTGVVGSGVDSTSKFNMSLPPGDYTLYAFDAESVEYLNPKVMEKYATQGVHISLSSREKKELTLKKIEVTP